MNPNYVLSEDERQKRFKKKKSSGPGNDSLQLEETNENQNFGKPMKPNMESNLAQNQFKFPRMIDYFKQNVILFLKLDIFVL